MRHLLDRISAIEQLCQDSRGYDCDEAARMKREAIIRNRRIKEKHPANLVYEEFLETDYWQWLSAYMKVKAGWKCQLCGVEAVPSHRTTGVHLEVHHMTYKHRGFEYPDHLEELIVLCGNCHELQHKKAKAEIVKGAAE